MGRCHRVNGHANADTFHFTNCAPQEWLFNRSARLWQGIEKYVLDNARAERERVTVFTGPVLADDDPPYRYVHVPMRFWKILVRVDRATTTLPPGQARARTAPTFPSPSPGGIYPAW